MRNWGEGRVQLVIFGEKTLRFLIHVVGKAFEETLISIGEIGSAADGVGGLDGGK